MDQYLQILKTAKEERHRRNGRSGAVDEVSEKSFITNMFRGPQKYSQNHVVYCSAVLYGLTDVADLLLEEEIRNIDDPNSFNKGLIVLLIARVCNFSTMEKVYSAKNINREIRPIEIAVCLGNVLAVKCLLEKGADVSYHNLYFGNMNCLHLACKGKFAIVDFLPSIFESLDDVASLLSRVNRSSIDAVAELLIDHGACTDKSELSALQTAALHGNKDIFKLLLGKKATPLQDEDVLLPYVLAQGSIIIKYLWKNICSGRVHTELMASELRQMLDPSDREEMAEILIFEKGVDVNERARSFGRTPLSYAAESGHESLVKLLLQNGADPKLKDDLGRTPLHYAIALHRDASDGIRYVLGQDDFKSFTVRVEAIAKLLIEHGISVDEQDGGGLSPLHLAAIKGNDLMINFLLDNDANIDLQTKDGITALHLAIKNQHESSVYLLINRGAGQTSMEG